MTLRRPSLRPVRYVLSRFHPSPSFISLAAFSCLLLVLPAFYLRMDVRLLTPAPSTTPMGPGPRNISATDDGYAFTMLGRILTLNFRLLHPKRRPRSTTPMCTHAQYTCSLLSYRNNSVSIDSLHWLKDVRLDQACGQALTKGGHENYLSHKLHPLLTQGYVDLCGRRPLRPVILWVCVMRASFCGWMQPRGLQIPDASR